MDILSQEMMSNILSRLPFKLIVQCRCVSKLWNSIICDSEFPSLRLTQHSAISPDLLLYYKAVQKSHGSRFYYLEDNQALDKRPFHPFARFDEGYLSNSFRDSCPFILGSFNGFICLLSPTKLVRRFETIFLPRNPIYVFNPLTEDHSELPPFKIPDLHVPGLRLNNVPKIGSKWLSGFGFEDSKKEFKMVLVIFVARDYESQIFHNEVLVHTLGTTTWISKIGVVPNALRKSEEIASSTFINGSLHWITVDQCPYNYGPLIVSFNLGLEEFGFVPVPDSHLFKYQFRRCKLGMFEKNLSIVGFTVEHCVDVWIMKKYNVKESWVKQFSIQQLVYDRRHTWTGTSVQFIKIRKNDELLLLLDKQHLVAYNTRTALCRGIQVGWDKKKKFNLEVHALVGSRISTEAAFGSDLNTKETTSAKRKR